jgi:hypothetical protein
VVFHACAWSSSSPPFQDELRYDYGVKKSSLETGRALHLRSITLYVNLSTLIAVVKQRILY